MGFIFYKREQSLEFQKLITLRVLLILGCLIGLCYLAMVPLALSDQRRLETKLDRQFAATGALYSDRAEKMQNTLKNVKTIQDLKALGGMLNLIPTPGERKALRLDDDFDQLQSWTSRQIKDGLNHQKNEVMEQHERELAKLQKDAIRIIAGAALAAICYFLLCSMNFVLFREHVPEQENPRRG